MSDRIQVTVKNHVADVKLVRADKMNALDDAMFTALIETTAELEANRDVRVVVLSGEGRAFCAGLDTSNFARMAGGDTSPSSVSGNTSLVDRTYGIANRAQQAVWGWRQLRMPVIAAAHGVAFGGGFQLLCGPDIRIVHPDIKLSILEVKWGLVPDMAGTPIMRNLAREDVLRELTYTGRIFSGTEAKEYGFATHVSEDPYAHAMTLAESIAVQSPSAVQYSKKLLNKLFDSSEAEALMTESVLQDKIMGTPNQVEAVRAGLEKRAGNYDDEFEF